MGQTYHPTQVHELMNDIFYAETDPAVYNVSLTRNVARTCFDATVTFRCSDINYLSAKGGTPEAALSTLKTELMNRFGPCELCGRKGPKPDED